MDVTIAVLVLAWESGLPLVMMTPWDGPPLVASLPLLVPLAPFVIGPPFALLSLSLPLPLSLLPPFLVSVAIVPVTPPAVALVVSTAVPPLDMAPLVVVSAPPNVVIWLVEQLLRSIAPVRVTLLCRPSREQKRLVRVTHVLWLPPIPCLQPPVVSRLLLATENLFRTTVSLLHAALH